MARRVDPVQPGERHSKGEDREPAHRTVLDAVTTISAFEARDQGDNREGGEQNWDSDEDRVDQGPDVRSQQRKPE